MANIGDSPVNFTLVQYNTLNNISLSSYTGKVILVSFVDFNNGWSWLKNLVAIQTSINSSGISANVQLLAVIFNYMSSVDEDMIATKINADSDLSGKITFPVLMDNAWASGSAYAVSYQAGFSVVNDPLFHGNTGTALWSYIIAKDYIVSDKWHPNGTVNADPISFNQMTSIGTFNSADLVATKAFVVQRIVNLNSAPAITKTTPAQTSLLNLVSTAKVSFSKLLSSAAGTASNYTLSGAGSAGLTIASASFAGADRVENVATLTFGGAPTSSGPLIITLNSAIKDTAGTSIPAGSRTITYTIDINAPTITLSQTPTAPTPGNVTVNVTITEANGVAVKKYASGSQTVSYFSSGGTELTGTTFTVTANGTYTVYAKDTVGNQAIETITITNIYIDNDAPVITLSQTPITPTTGDVTINVTVTEANGIASIKYAPGNQEVSFFTSTDEFELIGTSFVVSTNGTYTVYARDTAGNESVNTIAVSNIDKNVPNAFSVGAVHPVGGNVRSGFWNGTNTGIEISVPIENDPSLNGGSVQLQVMVTAIGTWQNLSTAVTVLTADLGTFKVISISAAQFESTVKRFAPAQYSPITQGAPQPADRARPKLP